MKKTPVEGRAKKTPVEGQAKKPPDGQVMNSSRGWSKEDSRVGHVKKTPVMVEQRRLQSGSSEEVSSRGSSKIAPVGSGDELQ
jgi:hypothetical protein